MLAIRLLSAPPSPVMGNGHRRVMSQYFLSALMLSISLAFCSKKFSYYPAIRVLSAPPPVMGNGHGRVMWFLSLIDLGINRIPNMITILIWIDVSTVTLQ